MLKRFLLISAGILSQAVLVFTSEAQGVCDELKGENVPKGLFGLCTAYCEATNCAVDPNQQKCDSIWNNFMTKAKSFAG